jgi:uncharacterized protein with von Willebrand factor type A (vWA) domain
MTTKEARLSSEDLTHKVSRWQRYLYDAERALNQGMRRAEQAGLDRNVRFPDYQRELFSRLYNPKTSALETPAEGSEWASKLHAVAQDMPEFKVLQERCKGDEVWAGMGTSSLAASVVSKMQPQKSKHNPEELRRRVEGLKKMSEQGVNVSKKLQQAEQVLEQAQKEAEAMAQGLDPVQLRQAVRQGCEQAQQEIGEAEGQIESFSYGSSPGTPVAKGNVAQKRELANQIARSSKLKKIAKLAGRLRRVAAEKQRSKVSDSRSEVSDIEQGDSIDRLLPSELMDLLNGDGGEREMVFYARFLDRQCLQYKLSGKEKVGRGPIVLCCDESGSMEGDNECWAKAVSLALLDIAQRQRRSWSFIHFDSRVSRRDFVKAGAVDSKALMECMAHFTGGGTCFQSPLDEAVRTIKEDGAMRKADVVFITDGCCAVAPEWVERFVEAKRALGFTVYAVLVDMQGQSMGAVEQFADHIYHMEDMLEGRGGKFEDVVFSL